MQDPDAPSADSSPFVDRVPEVEAFRSALLTHRARMDAGLIDTTELRNVLTFYGEGGAGKSELSRQLQDWATGKGSIDHWDATEQPIDVAVRWDFNDSFGIVDPHPLLVALRSELGAFSSSWPAFDLAFAAFHEAAQPGTELRFRTPREGVMTLSDVVTGLVGDALAVGGMGVTGGASAGVVSIGRHLLTKVKTNTTISRTVRRFDGLSQLIADAESLQADRERIAVVASRIMFMLNREIEAMAPAERPTVVVFVDHMERLQIPGGRHLGEAVLNRLVSRAPWILFVVTGRNSLRWHQVSDLPVSGPACWPLLSTENPPLDEPRQHSIGFLSTSDAEHFLSTSFAAMGIALADGVVEELARSTDGWPLHLQTILAVARGRATSERVLTSQDLGGSFPALVDRLLSDLPTDVAKAFRAACLLPYFDVEFVAAAGQVTAGAVEQLLGRRLVRANEGSVYPYRIHDSLRALVREAGSDAVGGWGAGDWARHTELALREAERRFDAAIATQDDVAAIDSLALGLNVATENNVFDPWLVDGIRESPTIQGLAPRISATPRPGAPDELADVLEFLELRARPPSEDVTSELLELSLRGSPIASSAALWRAYDLRARGRTADALDQIDALLTNVGDRPALYRNQYVTTLRLARRFRDASELLPFLSSAQEAAQTHSLRRSHGHLAGSAEAFHERVERASSRRFQVELLGDELAIRHRQLGVTQEEIDDVYLTAVQVGHRGTQAVCLGLTAELNLWDDDVVSDCLEQLEDLSQRRGRIYRAIPHVLAMRSLALGDPGAAAEARRRASEESYRSSSWIPTEILLEHLGHPLDPGEVQWMEPYADVNSRWLAIFGQIVDRARPIAPNY